MNADEPREDAPQPDPAAQRRTGTASLVKRLAWVIAGAFLFTFSLIPVYRIACEKVLGIKLSEGPAGREQVADLRVDEQRTVTVQFDGNVDASLPWEFRPQQTSIRVHPGEMYDASYWAKNVSARPIVGNAAPSLSPSLAGSYFHKTECFCFTQQTLAPGEARSMPVRFFVDPQLPANINTLTLSYRFYQNADATAKLEARGQAHAAHSAP